MKESPEEPQRPDQDAKQWLYAFEQCVRKRDYDSAEKLIHKNCLYFGLEFDHAKDDWISVWPNQLSFSFDMAATKFVVEGNLTVISTRWVAQGLIHGAPPKMGRASIALMNFTGDKLMAVSYHTSLQPK